MCSSDLQDSQLQIPDSTVGDIDYYYSDNPPREGIRNKNSLHPTPEVEEVKEVTEVSAVNIPLFPSTP